MQRIVWTTALGAALLLAGCSQTPKVSTAQPQIQEGPGTRTPGRGPGSGPRVVGGGGGGGFMAPPTPKATDPLRATPQYDAAITAAEKAGDKAALCKAYLTRGFLRMSDAKAGDPLRYGGALADFRKAVAADPTNTRAVKGMETAEAALKARKLPTPPDPAKNP